MATGNPVIATAAALELPSVRLDDALWLVLVYLRAGDRRSERSALRFHARLCVETPTVTLAAAVTALQALATLGPDEPSGAAGLAEILEALGAPALVRVLDEWACAAA